MLGWGGDGDDEPVEVANQGRAGVGQWTVPAQLAEAAGDRTAVLMATTYLDEAARAASAQPFRAPDMTPWMNWRWKNM